MEQWERQREIERAANVPFSMDGAQVQRERRPVRIVYSVRIPAEFSEEIAQAADEAEVTPSAMVATLVQEALQARRLASAETVTVSLAELHRAIDAAARTAA